MGAGRPGGDAGGVRGRKRCEMAYNSVVFRTYSAAEFRRPIQKEGERASGEGGERA